MALSAIVVIPAKALGVLVILTMGGLFDAVENSMDMNGVFMGIVVLCLTQFFVHGAELEKDVDGLL